MLTNRLIDNLNKIIDFIKKNDDGDLSDSAMDMIDTIWKVRHLLEIAPESYQIASEEDLKMSFYTAYCEECGWYGSSRLLDGGTQIADTGDYGDVYCPVCGNNNTSDYDEEK